MKAGNSEKGRKKKVELYFAEVIIIKDMLTPERRRTEEIAVEITSPEELREKEDCIKRKEENIRRLRKCYKEARLFRRS